MYEDPNVGDFEFTVVFGFAGELGADCEIHRENPKTRTAYPTARSATRRVAG